MQQFIQFMSRWIANCLGIAAATALNIISISGGIKFLIISGLLLALLNAVIKPILIIRVMFVLSFCQIIVSRKNKNNNLF